MPSHPSSSISRDVAAQELISAEEYEAKAAQAMRAGDFADADYYTYLAQTCRRQAEKATGANNG